MANLQCTIAICDGFNLLLPQEQIIELASAVDIQPSDKENSWSIGSLNWRGLQVPVLGIEQLVRQRAARLRGSHLAIFRGTENTEKLPFYAIPLQAVPHNYSVANGDELKVREDHHEPDFCAMKVTVRGVSTIIPDLVALESYLVDALQ